MRDLARAALNGDEFALSRLDPADEDSCRTAPIVLSSWRTTVKRTLLIASAPWRLARDSAPV